MQAGLAAEQAGDTAGAERELLAASVLSRKYDPRWTLAGFYFRQNKTDPFWFWAREALRVSYRDPEPLFDLAWQLTGDGAEIRRRLALETAHFDAWVRHAARTGRLDEIEAVLDRVLEPEAPTVAEALLAGRRVLALARLRGHDALGWRAIPQDGVVFAPRGAGFEIAFDGRQPEECDVAARIVPLPAVRVTWPIEGGVHGLAWRSEPFGAEGLWVTLHYRRPSGEVRAQGAVRVAE